MCAILYLADTPVFAIQSLQVEFTVVRPPADTIAAGVLPLRPARGGGYQVVISRTLTRPDPCGDCEDYRTFAFRGTDSGRADSLSMTYWIVGELSAKAWSGSTDAKRPPF